MSTASQIAVVQKQSPVWTYFQRIDSTEHLQAKCLIGGCKTLLSTPLFSTSTLIRHLRFVHKMTDFKAKEKLVNRPHTKKISLNLKKKLDNAAVAAIIEDGRGFGDFSKSGFQKFIQLALPGKKVLVTIAASFRC